MIHSAVCRSKLLHALFALPAAVGLTERFLPLAEGLRPGISTPTELSEGFNPPFRLASTASRALVNSSEASLTKYMRVWLMIWVRISRGQSKRFARASHTSSLGSLV